MLYYFHKILDFCLPVRLKNFLAFGELLCSKTFRIKASIAITVCYKTSTSFFDFMGHLYHFDNLRANLIQTIFYKPFASLNV